MLKIKNNIKYDKTFIYKHKKRKTIYFMNSTHHKFE